MVYVDDCIIYSKDKSVIDGLIWSLRHGPENYILTDEGEIDKYLGVDIVKNKDGSMELRQPFLIERCLKAMEIDPTMNIKRTPATKPLLHKDKDGGTFPCSKFTIKFIGSYCPWYSLHHHTVADNPFKSFVYYSDSMNITNV